MLYLLFYSTFFLITTSIEYVCSTSVSNHTVVNCTLLRDTFALASSNFSLCAVEHSRPIKLCEKCVIHYIGVLESYKNITQMSDDEGYCIHNFINKDRLEILNSIYSNTVDLWTRAKCYECFEFNNNSLTPNMSNQTMQFNELYAVLMECINGSNVNETTMCPKCMDYYVNLSGFYNTISNENEKIGMCMDIVDLMNITRSFWSKNCCKYRQHTEYIFLATTLIAFIMTAVFYILAKVCSDKKLADILPQSRFMGSLSLPSEIS